MDTKNNNERPIMPKYRKCPRCKSTIKANLWNCPVCHEGLNPHEYGMTWLKINNPERYRKIQQLKINNPEQYRKIQQKMGNDSNNGCGKGCGGCMAVIATIIAFIVIIFLLNNFWIIGLGLIICVAASVGYAVYQGITHGKC